MLLMSLMQAMGGGGGGGGGAPAPSPAPAPPGPGGGPQNPLLQAAMSQGPQTSGPAGITGKSPVPGMGQLGDAITGVLGTAGGVANAPLKALASFGRGLQPQRRNYIMGAPANYGQGGGAQ